MKKINRRTFSKKTAAALSGFSLACMAGCTNNESNKFDPRSSPVTGKVIDAHMHLRPYKTNPFTAKPEVIKHCFEVQDANYIRYSVNIGITGDDIFYRVMDMLSPYKDRIGTMYAFDWGFDRTDPDFFIKAPDMLERAVAGGALGLKCFKNLGLTVKDRDGSLLRIDDSRLFPIWERAEKLNMVVAFHSTDPVAFFAPWTSENERWKELELHPEWSFADRSKYPERDAVLEQRDNVIRQFQNVKFLGCHVANNSEDIVILSKRFDALPNLYADISARLGELGRHPTQQGHDFFTKYKDRLLFGTDHVFYADGDVQGAGPMRVFSQEENRKFYSSHWLYLQTRDKQFDHPTPIQGDWKIDGIGLDREVLEKVYWQNAFKLYRLDRFGIV